MLEATLERATDRTTETREQAGSHAAAPEPIAIMIGQLQQGGSERQLYAFLRGCDRERWSPVVYVSGELGCWEESIRQLGIPVVLLQGGRLSKLWQFRTACIRQGATSFFSWSSYTNGYGLAISGRGMRRIGSFRNTGFTDLPTRQRWLWSWMSLAGISTAVCNAPVTQQEVAKRCGSRQTSVYVPNAVDVLADEQVARARRMWRERLELADTDVFVLGVGRLEAAKNFARFVDVVDQVNKRIPIRAAVAGRDQGCLAALQAQVERLGLEGTISLLGSIPDARELMCAADVFLLTSDREGMPNVLLEAMAAGVACVATDVGAVSDIIQSGTNGFVGEKDVNGLTGHVVSLSGDADLRQAIGRRARETIIDNYQSEAIVRQLWSLCEKQT